MGSCVSSSKTAPAPQDAKAAGGGGGSGSGGGGGGTAGAVTVHSAGDGKAVTVLPAGGTAAGTAAGQGRKGGRTAVTVAVVGLDNAGKTTVVNNLLGDADDFVMPTMGFDLDTVRRRHFDAKMYGLGGASSIRGYWGNYYDEVHALVFVVDAADAARLDEAAAALREVAAASRVNGKPLLVYANKQDLDEALTAAELAERLGLTADGLGDSPVHVRQCVALTDPSSEVAAVREPDPSVVEAFDWLLDAVEERYESLSERIAGDKAAREAAEKARMEDQKKRVAAYREEEKAAAAAEAASGTAAAAGSPAPLEGDEIVPMNEEAEDAAADDDDAAAGGEPSANASANDAGALPHAVPDAGAAAAETSRE